METTRDRLRVLIVGDFPPPHGGVAVHVEMLQRGVREAGGEGIVLDIGKGQLPAEGVVPAGTYASFLRQLTDHARRGFLIHVHTSGANPKSWMLAAACAAAARLSGKPPVLTLHSGLAPAWLAESALRRFTAGRIAGAFGTVIAVSDPIADLLQLCGVRGRNLRVWPAFSHSFLQPGTPPDGFAELRAAAQPLLCAMLAPGEVYGAETLLRAFAELQGARPRARLALYGPGTTDPAQRLLAQRLCGTAADAVQAFGELPRASALALIGGSDLFVRPTLADGDSVSVREALALDRPVVATAVGTRPPGVRLVPPGDVLALAAALVEAVDALSQPRVATPASQPADPRGDCLSLVLALYRGEAAAPAQPAQPAPPQPAPALAPIGPLHKEALGAAASAPGSPEDRCAVSAAS